MKVDSAPSVLDSGKLSTHWLFRVFGKPRVEFTAVVSAEEHLGLVSNTISEKAIGIYVHVPYCKSICMFCPYFKRIPRDRAEIEKYFSALLREVEVYGKILEGKELDVVEVHVGGGTPSLVPPRLYKGLLEKLSEYFNVKCGIGIEANPEDLGSRSYVEELYSSGVSEVSIGVQSFDSRVLKSIGRKHKPEDNIKAVENSLNAGFDWVNVDLMFLTPSIKNYVEISREEALRAFTGDLARSFELGVHQITYYATVIPEGSPGYKLVELGRLHQNLEAIEDFVLTALEFAERRGLHLVRVYSISKKYYEYATVNLEMVGPLLGFGAGSWSNTGFYQYVNIHDVAKYVESVSKGAPPAMYTRRLSRSSRAWRVFFDQLSTARVSSGVFKAVGLRGIPVVATMLLKAMELTGLAEKKGDSYVLTKRGIVEVYKLVMNYVVEVPVKATRIFEALSKAEKVPQHISIS